ncbi:MAG: NADPH:quinone reductase [Alphaproteobacteria bacterium]
MRAVWYERTGAAREVLRTGELPAAEPGPGEVRVRLHASAVNPADAKRRAGSFGMEFPLIVPNSDGAGIVEAVGPGADPSLLGRRVWLFNGQRGRALGTAAECITLDGWLVAPLPDDMDFAEGACLGIPCMTAHRNVFCDGPVEGKTVLVTGGAGAVGHYAVQWAKWGGATVIATVSDGMKGMHARDGGADHTIDYRNEDVAARVKEITGGAGADLVVEVDLARNLKSSTAALKPGGTIAVYASTGDPERLFFTLALKCAALRFMALFAVPRPEIDRIRADMARFLASGTAIHRVAARFPLGECAAAHELVESGDKIGTVVVEPQR